MNPFYQVFIILFPFASSDTTVETKGLNINILLLLNIEDCELAEIETDTVETYIQLLQLSDYDRTKVRQCKVEIDRTIFYCTRIPRSCKMAEKYLQTFPNDACQKIHKTGTLSLGGNAIISRATWNSTIISSVNLAGSTSVDGHCSGTQYSDSYVKHGITWSYRSPLKSPSKSMKFQSNAQCSS